MSILISIFLLEIGSYAILYFSNLSEVQNEFLLNSLAKNNTSQPPMYLIHPYYGFIVNPAYIKYLKKNIPNHPYVDHVPNVNRYGFFGEDEYFFPRGGEKLEVAIVGGSVACFEAAQGHDLLVKKLEELYNKSVHISNLAIWAGKEPQQLIILTDLIGKGVHFDIVINIDGFNEIALPFAHGNISQHIPAFFPQGWKDISNINEQDNSTPISLFIRNIKFVNRVLNSFEENFLFLKTVKLIFIIQNKFLNNIAKKFEQKIRCSVSGKYSDYQINKNGNIFLGQWSPIKSDEEYYNLLARHWFRCSIMMHNIVESQCGRYFHFLQPNQYTDNKILTDKEKMNAFSSNNIYRKYVKNGYPILRQYGKKLKQLGVAYKDLTTIFENTRTSVYKDTCCHFNQSGVEAIVRAVVKTIRDNPEDSKQHMVSLCPH